MSCKILLNLSERDALMDGKVVMNVADEQYGSVS